MGKTSPDLTRTEHFLPKRQRLQMEAGNDACTVCRFPIQVTFGAYIIKLITNPPTLLTKGGNSMNRATDISSLPLVFSVPEAAQLIGIGKNTMYYIIKEGQIPCIRIGRQIRISRTALLKYLGIDQ